MLVLVVGIRIHEERHPRCIQTSRGQQPQCMGADPPDDHMFPGRYRIADDPADAFVLRATTLDVPAQAGLRFGVVFHRRTFRRPFEDPISARATRFVQRTHSVAGLQNTKSARTHQIRQRSGGKEIDMFDAEFLKGSVELRFVTAGVRDFQKNPASFR